MLSRSLLFICYLICSITFVCAETITIKEGATFELPTGLVTQPKQNPPVVGAWANQENTVAVFLMILNRNDKEMNATGLEFKDWPSVGLSTVKGFGNSIAKSLESTLKVPCSFTGHAEGRDFTSSSFWISVDTSCKTLEGYNLKSRVIQIFLDDSIAMIRVDASPPTEKFAEKVAATIWNSIQVHPSIRLKILDDIKDTKSDKASLSGGKGFFITDYRTQKPASLVGLYLGAIIGAILFGMFLTHILLKFKLKPITALLISQIFIILLRVYGAEENGAWELDPILYFVTSTISIAVLWKWAKKKHLERFAI